MFNFTILAGFALFIGGVLHIRKHAPRFVAFCALIVGANVAGWAGKLLTQLGGTVGNAVDTLGAQLIGVAVSGGLAAGAITWLYLDLRKKGKVSKAAPVLGLIVPSLLPMLYGSLVAIPALSGVPTAVNNLTAAFGAGG
jgi:mannose/fructose/N-acetylgalactosamine-specific phosphotransferase system component IID